MRRPQSGKTRTDAVYAKVRADILAGRLAPGTRLKFAPLCEEHQASVGLIREVLSRLAEQGLVLAEPQVGFQVMPISEEDLRDLTSARTDIEGLALRYSIERGDVTWEARVIAAHHTLGRSPRTLPTDPGRLSDQWAATHAAFHSALIDGCGSPRLYSMARSLRDAAELYRRWSVPLGEETQTRAVEAEHRQILDATIARDADRAVSALTAHIRNTAELILQGAGLSLPAWRDPFDPHRGNDRAGQLSADERAELVRLRKENAELQRRTRF